MSRLLKSRDYLMKCLGFILLFGFISFATIGGCNNDGSIVDRFLDVHQTGQTTSHAPGDCGLTDGSEPGSWRVANIRELHSLIDYGNSPTLPEDHPFLGIDESTSLWTSNTADSDSTQAYILDFEHGEVVLNPKTGTAGCMLKGVGVSL